MQTIATLEGVEFLRASNRIRHAVEDLMKKTQVLELRKNMPVLTGEETPEERQEKIAEQSRKNISDMLDRLLEEYPEETYRLIKACIVDVENPDGMDMLLAVTELLSSQKVIDFFVSLVNLVQKNTPA